MWVEAEIKSHSDDVELIINCAYGLGAIGATVETPVLTAELDIGTYKESHSDLYRVITTFESPFVRSDRVLFRRRLNRLVLQASLPRIEYRYVGAQDFSNEWRKIFSVQRFGRLMLRPSWISEEPSPDEVEMVLDPGFAFGSGLHITTQLCLELLEQNISNQTVVMNVIDVGTGSGILSIGSALIGTCHVRAFDIDSDSIEIAKVNARMNGVSDSIDYEILDFSEKIHGKFCNLRDWADLVVANISEPALVSMMNNFSSSIKLGGQLIMSGFEPSVIDNIVTFGTEAGFELSGHVARDEWSALIMTRKF
ncbi:MAG: 50S ribosomal protein L11 methyltransferase [Chloroflexota bacterium]|nr:50S ribosomal protein L11 methyltransferase [Chloroflexota bacterium]